ncbi:MAG: peptidoglycan-binding domain-containing protein [Cyanobacteriota bacterium]|nr:peptidoglycan-binding domain-containing protein [Cyanobacteriota bacterium]
MNDIGLLITSALATGHPSVPYLLNETAVELNLSVKESNLIQSAGLATPARVTPPEFISSSGIQIASRVFSPKNEDVLQKIRNRIDSLDCCRFSSRVISATDKPIIIESPSIDTSPSSAREIILPSSTSPPSLIDAIDENTTYVTPRFQQTYAGASRLRRTNSVQFFSSYTQTFPSLRFGTSGLSVRILQRLLLANGYPIRVDGNFGALTETAVKAFQSNRNLIIDGVVGRQTWRELTRE